MNARTKCKRLKTRVRTLEARLVLQQELSGADDENLRVLTQALESVVHDGMKLEEENAMLRDQLEELAYDYMELRDAAAEKMEIVKNILKK